MRITFVCCLVGFLSLCGTLPAQADERTQALAILDKAIVATGGADQALRVQTIAFHTKGKFDINGMEVTTSSEWMVRGIGQYHCDVESVTAAGETSTGALVLNGDKGWLQSNGQARELPKEIVNFLQSDFRAARLTQALALLKANEFELAPLGELKLDNRAILGLRIAEKGQPEVSLWFDKETSLPVKAEVRVTEPQQSQETTHEFRFAEYKEFEGVKLFTRATLNREGKKTFETQLSQVTFPAKHDDNVFAKP